jgi:hypothetical protein
MRGFYAISCQFLPICPHTGWRLERGRRPNILGLLADEAGRRAQPQPAPTAASWPTLRWSCLVRSRSGSERWSPNSAKRRVSRLAVLSPWCYSIGPRSIHETAAGAPPWSALLIMRHKGLPSPPANTESAGCWQAPMAPPDKCWRVCLRCTLQHIVVRLDPGFALHLRSRAAQRVVGAREWMAADLTRDSHCFMPEKRPRAGTP